MLQHWGGSAIKTPLPIYGPPGVEQVVSGFQTAYSLDEGYRIAHHGAKVMDPAGFGGQALPIAIDAANPDVTVINTPDLKVRAILVDHGPVAPALGYVFEYKGRKVVISGDTKPSARLEAAAKGADVLVHEALSKELVQLMQDSATKAGRANYAAIFHDIQNYHTTPQEAAAIAQRAGVKLLLLNHIVPTLRLKALEGPFLGQSRQIFKGRLILGKDGDLISLPANDQAIKVKSILD
jgi:ribonuclease Z